MVLVGNAWMWVDTSFKILGCFFICPFSFSPCDEVVQHLLKVGADKEKRSRDTGWTPLHFAAWNGHLEVVRLLLDFGAMKMVVAKDGATPLKMAHDNYWNDDIVDLLS